MKRIEEIRLELLRQEEDIKKFLEWMNTAISEISLFSTLDYVHENLPEDIKSKFSNFALEILYNKFFVTYYTRRMRS
jgi:hypothetical protein